MKIWVLSDLHQEFVNTIHKRHPRTLFDPNAVAPHHFDMIVAAGDISVPLGASMRWLQERFPGVPKLYVAGNHDYYQLLSDSPWTIESLLSRAADEADRFGVTFLENGTATIDGTRFVGATLWTDFHSIGTRTMEDKVRLAMKHMSDYRQIRTIDTRDPYRPRRLLPSDTIYRHRASRAYIAAELAKPFDGKSVVVSHHAPHPASLNPKFGGELDWCFASDLTDILHSPEAPALWIHGHIHHASDYRAGKTRVVANPRGYAFIGDSDEGRGFVPALVVDTDAHQT